MRLLILCALCAILVACGSSTNGASSGSSGSSGTSAASSSGSTSGASTSGTSTSGGSSGSTGAGGWSNSWGQSAPVVQANAETSSDSQPGTSDNWWVTLSDDSFTAHASDAHTDTSASFTIATSGNAITITGTASAQATLDSNTSLVPQCGSTAAFGDPNLCFRSAGATSIHFAFDCSGSTASGVASNGGGVGNLGVSFHEGSNNPQILCVLGSDVSADVTSGSIDVAADSTGQACLRSGDALDINWAASAGRPSDNSTSCSASVSAHIVITATAH